MKKKILLVWWYDRKDLIAPFLEMQDEIEFTVLFYRFPQQEDKAFANTLPFRRIYWLDYHSPYQIIRDVKPEKILFFGNDSVLTIALIAAANVLKVDTCYVSHGLRSELDEIISGGEAVQTIERYREDNKYYTSKKWHTLIFLCLVLSYRNIKTIGLVIEVLIAEFKIKNTFKKLLFIKNSLRKVKFYYLFAPENSLMIKELDCPKDEQIFYTGPYMMDQIFRELNENSIQPRADYWLLIDQPINGMTIENKFNLYKNVSLCAASHIKNLVVKVHPMFYNKNFEDFKNIKWVKETKSLSELILNSEGVLGFYSALFLPIIYFKKCILFDTGSTNLVKKWADLKVVQVVEQEFVNNETLNFDNFTTNETNRSLFKEQFISYTDGYCTERLKQLILTKK